MYCEQDERVRDLMVFVCELDHTRVYLYRENTFPGRCVVVWKKHVQKVTELSREERRALMDDVGSVADAVASLYHPDKINYLILGDNCPHLHVHIVPKYKETPEWGRIFEMMPQPPQFLEEEEAYHLETCRICRELGKKPE